MKEIKLRREMFVEFDYASIERHLENMAAKGWKLIDIEYNIWTY